MFTVNIEMIWVFRVVALRCRVWGEQVRGITGLYRVKGEGWKV